MTINKLHHINRCTLQNHSAGMMFKLSLMICSLALVVLLTCVASAQTPPRQNPLGAMGADRSSSDSRPPQLSQPEEEMMVRRELKAKQKAREENLERAREVAQIGVALRDTFVKTSSLSREDWKKVERLEKLTRRIRSEAGGSEDDFDGKEIPAKLGEALARVAELSEALRKDVEKTPRQVVSAGVIERTNQLIETLRYVRTFQR